MASDVSPSATQVSSPANTASPKNAKGGFLRWNALIRWLHLYVSMIGFASMIFFAFTGITLNHPTWFGGETGRNSTLKGKLDTRLLQQASSNASDDGDESGVDRLEVAETLRLQHHLRGRVSEFRVDADECLVAFKGPGYSADAFIDRTNGNYEISLTEHGMLSKWNDLHKGRDCGIPWSVIIDLSALIMIVSGTTGFAMLLFMKKKRASGIWTTLAGTVLFIALCALLVP